MINSTIQCFPNNVIALIRTRLLQTVDPEETDPTKKIPVYLRPLRSSDSVQCIGIFPTWWLPDEDSFEIGKSGPTVQRYPFVIQTLVKDAEEERATAAHGIMSKLVRSTLYNDSPLHVGLAALYVDMFGTREKFQKLNIQNQRYLNNEVSGSFIYMSTLNVYVETET